MSGFVGPVFFLGICLRVLLAWFGLHETDYLPRHLFACRLYLFTILSSADAQWSSR